MGPRGDKNDDDEDLPEVKLKIDIMYSIAKFMKNFNYKFDEVLNLEWDTFNNLLEPLRVFEEEAHMKQINTALEINTVKHSKDFKKAYTSLQEAHSDKIKSFIEFDSVEREEYLMQKRIKEDLKKGSEMLRRVSNAKRL